MEFVVESGEILQKNMLVLSLKKVSYDLGDNKINTKEGNLQRNKEINKILTYQPSGISFIFKIWGMQITYNAFKVRYVINKCWNKDI